MTAAAPPAGRPDARAAALVVAGAAGRMGTRIVALARDTPDVRVVAALEAAGHRALGADVGELAGIGPTGVTLGSDAAAAITTDRVLVEFSVPDASLEHLRLVRALAVADTRNPPDPFRRRLYDKALASAKPVPRPVA